MSICSCNFPQLLNLHSLRPNTDQQPRGPGRDIGINRAAFRFIRRKAYTLFKGAGKEVGRKERSAAAFRGNQQKGGLGVQIKKAP